MLFRIQSDLKAPKGQTNNFGKYKYRSCEDILEAVKPLLSEHGGIITLHDDLVMIGDRYYVKATATYTASADDKVSVSSYAREPANKKGMDESQITGTASSYARKYALNGLLLIDDSKDADSNEHKNQVDNTPVQLITADQAATIEALISDVGANKEAFLKYLGVTNLKELYLSNYDNAVNQLERKRK